MASTCPKREMLSRRDPNEAMESPILGAPDASSASGLSSELVPNLCQRCRKLDLEASYLDLGSRGSWSPESCELCQWLSSLSFKRSTISSNIVLYRGALPPLSHDGRRICRLLREFSNSDDNWSYFDNLIFISSSIFQNLIRAPKPEVLDYDMLRDWLQICRDEHPTRCRSRQVHVPYLQVIDCETRTLVPAEEHLFVTLSYSWGPSGSSATFEHQLPDELPRTIEDAMLVTKRLGYRYIWIDRYCISRSNQSHALAQMQHMDSIYHNSEITLIAAAGTDPSYGLPGVGQRHRGLPGVQMGSDHRWQQLTDSSLLTTVSVEESHWGSRGWTYQEGLLSRRRLVFTDQQVYFECGGMCCYEAMTLPYAKMHTANTEMIQPRYHNKDSVGIFPSGVGSSAQDIFFRVQEFSQRLLTHQSDRLNAFLGILKVFETQYWTRHLWGLPMDAISLRFYGDWQQATLSFALGLGFFCERNGTRIPGLPSWSWVGWSSAVHYSHLNRNNTERVKLMPGTAMRVSQVELKDGQLWPWTHFHEIYHEIYGKIPLLDISPFIHVEAWTIPVRLVRRELNTTDVELTVRNGIITMSLDNLNGNPSLPCGSAEGVLLWKENDHSLMRGSLKQQAWFLLVNEVDGVMERVGAFTQSEGLYSANLIFKDFVKGGKVFISKDEWWAKLDEGLVKKTIRLG